MIFRELVSYLAWKKVHTILNIFYIPFTKYLNGKNETRKH